MARRKPKQCPSGKVRYRNLDQASQEALRLFRLRLYSKHVPGPYSCRRCHGYHVGHSVSRVEVTAYQLSKRG